MYGFIKGIRQASMDDGNVIMVGTIKTHKTAGERAQQSAKVKLKLPTFLEYPTVKPKKNSNDLSPSALRVLGRVFQDEDTYNNVNVIESFNSLELLSTTAVTKKKEM